MDSTPTRRPIQPSDLYQIKAVGQVALHPDGESTVYAITWPDQESDTNRSQLFVHTKGASPQAPPIQLSYGHSDTGATFSPQGDRLVFVRRSPQQPARLMMLDWVSRQITEVVSFVDGVEQVVWVDDDCLAVLAPRRPDDQLELDDTELGRRPRVMTRLDYRFNGRGWTHDRPRQPATIDLTSSNPQVAYLSDTDAERGYNMASTDHVGISVSPDGEALVVVAASDHDCDLTGANHVWVHSLNQQSASRQLTETGGRWGALAWHREGSVIAVGTTDAAQHGFSRPYRFDLDSGEVTVLGPHDVNASPVIGVSGGLALVDGGVLLSGPRHGGVNIDQYQLADGAISTRVAGNFQVLAFDASSDGARIVASVTSPDRPAELWDFTTNTPTRLVRLNDDLLDQLDLAHVETVSVTGPDGTTIEAFLTRPPASVAARSQTNGDTEGSTNQRWPGLVYVHGGPMSQYGYCFFDEFQMAAAEGFVVIAGNPRGSDGYGEHWAQSIIGCMGTIDWDDVTAITDHLANQDDVDETRIGIGGGSYGGFMASWAIGHTNRYKAALVERAVTTWPSMAGTSDIGAPFVPLMLNADPDTGLDELIKQSPLTYAANIETPTLIVHSEQDWRCPIEQAEQLFTAIRRNGVEVTLARFPGENHELSRSGSPLHRIERFKLVHDFFHRHLD